MTKLSIFLALVLLVVSILIFAPKFVKSNKKFSVHLGNNGWWAHIEGHAYPFGAWRMDRGPYPFRWMAELEFPIERMTKDGPRR